MIMIGTVAAIESSKNMTFSGIILNISEISFEA